ncbi:beta-lactamase/transpeptidase-like protein [Daedaleopsis nitida]|nr:beta-lactamase/transpeptidase-like protein [Daedaleopsis nitida]
MKSGMLQTLSSLPQFVAVALGASQTLMQRAHGKIVTPELSASIKGVLDKASIPGLSLGLVRLGDNRQPVIELTAWGRQTEDAEEDDLTPDALFALASCSKAFLTASVGLVMDDYAHGRNVTPLPDGVTRFDWDTRLCDLLPGQWGLQDEWAESRLSLRDAFSHMSGMPRHDYSYRPGETAAHVLQRLKHLRPAYELREQWMYNNQMFMIGAHLISQLANTSYASFVESRIFDPLNMTSSSFSPYKAAKTGRLTQTWTRGSRRIPFWFPDDVAELFAGAGGIISSAVDMTKWLATLLNEGVDPVTNRTVVPPSVFIETTTAHTVVSGAAMGDLSIIGYGMGWFRMSYRGHDVVWHFGAIPGFSLLVAFLPEDNLGTVLLTNIDEKYDDTLLILYRIIDEALALPPPAHAPSRAVTFQTSSPARAHRTSMQADSAAADHGQSPLGMDAYAGTYHDAAYGTITLCAPNSTSAECIRVLDDFARVDAVSAPAPAPSSAHRPSLTLYAAWPRVWSTHLRLKQAGGTAFAATAPALFPSGYGRDRTPFEFYDSQISVGHAEFVVEDGEVVGFALVMEEQAAAARARRTGGDVREVGDAWFARVP